MLSREGQYHSGNLKQETSYILEAEHPRERAFETMIRPCHRAATRKACTPSCPSHSTCNSTHPSKVQSTTIHPRQSLRAQQSATKAPHFELRLIVSQDRGAGHVPGVVRPAFGQQTLTPALSAEFEALAPIAHKSRPRLSHRQELIQKSANPSEIAV